MTDSLEVLRAALADRYTIERELGRGATAIVYLATDLKHDRKVAIKVLNPELALAVRAERFLREIQIVARLAHPHILALHDSGEAAGAMFYVTPYVAGQSLRERLNREKQLPVDEAVRITREVADALSYAHKQGIVHRDLKPENILLHEGHVLVADFGIARALSTSGVPTSITESGLAVGTPAYMSPEQAAGGEVDPRADIYSLGCILYEMLAGHPPFIGGTAQEILARHTLDPIPNVRAARPDITESLQSAIRRALAKAPVARFEAVTGFASALSQAHEPRRRRIPARAWVALVAVVVALLGIGQPAWLVKPFATARRVNERSVGVLACLNLTTDSSSDYFSEGMAAELIDELSRIPGLQVPVLTSSLALKGRNLSVRQVAETLGVASILECTVRRAGGRLRLGARLVHARDGVQLWSESYDRDVSRVADVIALEEAIAREVVTALPSSLSLTQVAVGARHTSDSVAHNLYLQGMYFLRRRTERDYKIGIAFLDSAVRHDPGYALAYAALTHAYTAAAASGFWSMMGLPARQGRLEAYRRAREAAFKAIALDSMGPESHEAMGKVHYWADWDWAAAERDFVRALRLNPNLAEAHDTYGQLLSLLGRYAEASSEAHKARLLDPLSPSVNMGSTFLFAHQYDDAIREYSTVATLVPDYPVAHGNLGRVYNAAGRYTEAIIHLRHADSLRGRQGSGPLGYAYAKSGRRDEALKILHALEARPLSEARWQGLAWAYMGLGRTDQAIEAIVNAVENREVNAGFVCEPVWDPLRSDPRIRELRKKIGLPA